MQICVSRASVYAACREHPNIHFCVISMFAQNLALIHSCDLRVASLTADAAFPRLEARSHHDQGYPSPAPRPMA